MRELEKVETREEADEFDRKIIALTAQLDEDDARYAPRSGASPDAQET